MKVLVWTLCCLALAVSAFLGSRSGGHTVVVRAGGAQPTVRAGTVACPPRTLPDDGACVPVPRPRETAEVVPRIPSRPEAFQRYELPASGRLLVGSWADVAGDAEAPLDGPAWIFAAEPDSEVVSVALGGQAPSLEARRDDWLLLSTGTNDGPRLLALLGPLAVREDLAVGAPLAPGTVLGRARRFGLGFAVRELRPDAALGDGFAVLDDAKSVGLDPRNVLTVRAPEP